MRTAAWVLVLSIESSAAWAQPRTDAVAAALERGDFEEALALLDGVEQQLDLAPGALVVALTQRATAAHALGDSELLTVTVGAIARLEPDYAWPVATPPAIVEAFREAVERIGPSLAVSSAPARSPNVPAESPVVTTIAPEPEASPIDATLRAPHRQRDRPPPWGWIAAGIGAALAAGAVTAILVLTGSDKGPTRVLEPDFGFPGGR